MSGYINRSDRPWCSQGRANVNYSTYAIPGLLTPGICRGRQYYSRGSTNQVTVAWNSTPTTGPLTVSGDQHCRAGLHTGTGLEDDYRFQPLLHAYFYFTFDPTRRLLLQYRELYGRSERFGSPEWSLRLPIPGFRGRYRSHVGTASQQWTFPITGAYTPPYTFPVTLPFRTLRPDGPDHRLCRMWIRINTSLHLQSVPLLSLRQLLYGAVNFWAGSLPKPPRTIIH